MIELNRPTMTGRELEYMQQAIDAHKISGDGQFTRRCSAWLEARFNARKVLLTTSGASALDMAALLCGIEPGDEVILPSFTSPSTANAFLTAGARLVFVDIRPDTMNIDPSRIEAAVTGRTRVIAPVHYAGVACEMDAVMDIARRHGLKVVEDAAQGVMSACRDRALGAIGDFGCWSFDEAKNFSMGEGGALVINDPQYDEAAEILREKGTNRSKFYRGQIDKYTWVDFGDSYLPSDMNAACLWAQLERADAINADRLATWNAYDAALRPLADRGLFDVPTVPEGCAHNAHMYYIKCRDQAERGRFIAFMRARGVQCAPHFIPLHSTPAGKKYGRFDGEDVHTTRESRRLVRLPMYFGLTAEARAAVVDAALDFFNIAVKS